LWQSPCSSASGRTDSGLAVRRSSAASRKTPGLQADSRSSELKSFCRPAEGRVFRPPRPLTGCSCKRHVLAHGRLPARYQRSRASGGRVRFQSGYREVDLCPHSDPGEPWLPRRELSAYGVRGSGAVPVTGGLGRGNRSGSIAEAVAYIASGRLLATGLGSCSSSEAIIAERRRTLLVR
jgi:hypothetical protein